MIISRLHFLLLFVFGIVDSNTALGQGNEPFIVGRVWEATSKAPAKFANVYFKNSGLGTISNEDGLFKLLIPAESSTDTLIVSFVGFKPQRVGIALLSLGDTLLISLQESVTELNPIEVTALSPLVLLQKALRSTSAKSLTPAILNTYYREFVSKNGHYIKFADALVDYFVQYRADDFPEVDVKITESRAKSVPYNTGAKSLGDIEIPEPINLEILPRFFDIEKKFEVRFNPLDYEFESYDETDGKRDFYKIQFKPKSNVAKVLYKGNFLIDKVNEIIHSVEYEIPDENVKYIEVRNLLGVKFQVSKAKVYVQFQMIGDKCHLKYAKATLGVHVYNKKDYNVTHLFTSEMLVNKVGSNVEQYSNREKYKKNSIYKRGNNYQTPFWKGQRALLATEEEERIIETLQAGSKNQQQRR